MKIFFDTSPLENGHQGRGIGIYTKNLVTALKRIPTIGVETGIVAKGGFECDLIHYPYFDFFFHTLPFRKIARTVVTIHDTIPLIFKKEIPPGIKGEIRGYLQKKSLSNVSAVITDSKNSKVDIENYLQMPEDKVFAIPLAVDEEFEQKINKKVPYKSLKLPHKYFLYVGDININKNLKFLIQSFNKVEEKVDLVIVSKALNNTHIKEAQEIISEISHSRKKGRIHLLTHINQDVLPFVYARAFCYVQPSLYEGFGLPVLEAFASKVPVISSFSSSLPEVGGSAVLYFDPTSSESLEGAFKQMLSLTQKQRNELIDKGTQQKQIFSWDQTAKETLAVYKKILAKT